MTGRAFAYHPWLGEGPEHSVEGLPMEVQGGDRLMEAEARKTWAKTERIPPLGGGSHCGRTLAGGGLHMGR